jgi:hypothetical protein
MASSASGCRFARRRTSWHPGLTLPCACEDISRQTSKYGMIEIVDGVKNDMLGTVLNLSSAAQRETNGCKALTKYA